MINHKAASETREKQFDSCNLRKPDIEKDNTHRAYTFTSQIELNLIPRLFTNMNTNMYDDKIQMQIEFACIDLDFFHMLNCVPLGPATHLNMNLIRFK